MLCNLKVLFLQPMNVQVIGSQGPVITRVKPCLDIRFAGFQFDRKGDRCRLVRDGFGSIEMSHFQTGGTNVDGLEVLVTP